MAANSGSQRQRATSLSRSSSPKSLPVLSSDYQRLQDQVYQEFPDLPRVMYDFRDAREACKALFMQNRELLTKVLQLNALLKTGSSPLSNLKLKSDNIDLAEKLKSYSDLIVKLSNENDYYAKHIENLLSQLKILKTDPRKAQIPKLKLAELQEQVIIKNEEIKLLQTQIQTRGKVPLDARSAIARAEALQTRLNAELADKELQKFSKQEFLGHMHTQAKAIEKLMFEVSSRASDPVDSRAQLVNELKSRNASLTQQLELAQKQASAAPSAKRLPSSSLSSRQRAALEEVNDLMSLNEIPKASERWRELNYVDLPQESCEKTNEMLRAVLRLRDSALERRRKGEGDEQLREALREKDAEIDILKNTLLGGMDTSSEAAALRSQVRSLTEELRQKEAEIQDVIEERSASPENESVCSLRLALKRKDQELSVLLDELVELRKVQEPSDAFRAAMSDKSAKILRLETELGLFRGSPEALSTSIAAVLTEFAGKSRVQGSSEELVEETAEKLKKVTLKTISDKIVEEAEAKVNSAKEGQIAEMHNKIQSLEAAAGTLRRLLEEEKEAHSSVLQQISSHRSSDSPEQPHIACKKELDSAREECAALAKKLSLMTQENDRLRNSSTPSLGGKEGTQKLTKEHVERIKELQEENNALKERVYDLEFQQKTQEIQGEKNAGERETMVTTLKAEIKKLKEAEQGKKGEEQRQAEEISRLQKLASEQASRCASMNEELDDRKLELTRIYQQLDAAFVELKATKEATEGETAALKAKLAEKSDIVEDLTEQVKALTSELQHQTEDSEAKGLAAASDHLLALLRRKFPALPLSEGKKSADADVGASLVAVMAASEVISQAKPQEIEVSSLSPRQESTPRSKGPPVRSEEKAKSLSENPSAERKSAAVPPEDGRPGEVEEVSKWAIAKWQSAEEELVRVKNELAEVRRDAKSTSVSELVERPLVDVKTLQNELKKAKRAISELQREAAEREKRTDVVVLKQDLKTAEIDRMEAEQAITRLQSELDYTQSQLKRVVVDAETKESAWKQALTRLKDLIKARFDLEKQPIVLLDPYVNPLAFLETLSSEFHDLNQRKAAEKDKVARVVSDFHEAKQTWSEREEDLHAAIQTANREKIAAEMSLQSVQNQLSVAKQELDLTKEMITRLEATVRERPTEEQLRDVYEKGRAVGLNEAKKADKSELDSENRKLQALLKDYKDSLEETKRKWKETQERLCTTARLNNEMSGQLQVLTRELESEHAEKARIGADLQSKTEFFERVLREVESTKQFYHK